MKELWIIAEELFIEKHGRCPTDKEMQEAYIDYVSGIADSRPDYE